MAAVIGSILKAMDIMQLFDRAKPNLSLAEICHRLKIPKSTGHSILATLRSGGLVEQLEDGTYVLGKEIVALTRHVFINVELRDRSAPLLRRLAERHSDSVYLTVLDGHSCLYIYAVETSHRLRARSAIGDRTHLHCTGVGKAILAFLPDERRKQILAETGLPAFTERTITDARKLERVLSGVREKGYSVDNAEHEEGSFCVGAPIFNAAGVVIGACSIASDDPEAIASRLNETAVDVTWTAQEISRLMGFVPLRSSVLARHPV